MNRKLSYLYAINALFTFAGSLLVPIFAIFVEDIGGNVVSAGSLFGLYFVSGGIISLALLRYKDNQISPLRFMYFNYLLRGAGWLLLAFFPMLETLIVAQIVLGMAEGIGSPAFNALVSEHLDPNKHVGEWSIWSVIQNVTIAAAGVLGGFIVARYGFTLLFFIMSLLAFGATIFIFLWSQFHTRKWPFSLLSQD